MTIVQILAQDQILSFDTQPKLAAGDKNSVTLQVEFSPEWDGYNNTAVFYTQSDKDTIFEMVLVDGSCIIPHEVLEKPDTLYIGIRGVNADASAVKTSFIIKTKIAEGAPVGSEEAREPTPDTYQQILTEYGKTNDALAQHKGDKTNPHGVTAAQVGAAPSGYGLGEQNSRSTNNWADAVNSFKRGNTGSPDGEWWHGIICKEYGNITTNLAFKPNNGVWLSAMRGRTSNGTWGEWEYVNPPMMEGVEYRTTERFNGKPVYVKMINCGTLPNAFYKEYTVTSATKANMLDIVRLDGYISIIGAAEKVPIWVVSDVDFRFYGNNRLRITTTGDKSYLSAYVAVYYTLSE